MGSENKGVGKIAYPLTQRLDSDEVRKLDLPGRSVATNFITEPGMHSNIVFCWVVLQNVTTPILGRSTMVKSGVSPFRKSGISREFKKQGSDITI